MKVTQPQPDLLVLAHGPSENFPMALASIGLRGIWAVIRVPLDGPAAVPVRFGLASAGSRLFEHVRLVFDRIAGAADGRCRTILCRSGLGIYGLREIGCGDVRTRQGREYPPCKPVRAIADGPHVERPAINRVTTDQSRVPCCAETISHWVEKNR